MNAVVPESFEKRLNGRRRLRVVEAARSASDLTDGVPGSVFTMLVYDGMNAMGLRKTQPGISGVG